MTFRPTGYSESETITQVFYELAYFTLRGICCHSVTTIHGETIEGGGEVEHVTESSERLSWRIGGVFRVRPSVRG
jgi:hypothetical protein